MSNIREDFSFERKQRLAAKINDMRDKTVLKKIKDIIFANNPNITARKSGGGYLMYFQNYTNETYHKIERLLNKIEIEKLEQQTKTITETSDQFALSSEDPTSDYNMSRTRLRYSNREKRLIRRCQYEDIINEPISSVQSENMSDTKLEPISVESKKYMTTQSLEQNDGRLKKSEPDLGKKTKKSNIPDSPSSLASSNHSVEIDSNNSDDPSDMPKYNTKTVLIKPTKKKTKIKKEDDNDEISNNKKNSKVKQNKTKINDEVENNSKITNKKITRSSTQIKKQNISTKTKASKNSSNENTSDQSFGKKNGNVSNIFSKVK